MFCPQCKAEYRPGFTECADCHVPLVKMLPVEAESGNPDAVMVNVMETWDITDIALIKAALEGADIGYFIQGEILKHLRPFDQPAIVMVSEEDAGRAVDVLKELDLKFYRMIFRPQS